jgi:hypothetical protein
MFALGETTVNCSASDLAEPANTSNGSFTVTVEDTTGPEITVPGDDVEVVSEDGEGVLVEYSVSATDLVDGEEVSLECTPASGSTFSVGTTEVVCTSTDQTGNSSEASFNVTVFDGNIPPDTTAPVITLNGSAVVEIDLGDEYNEQGATATDNVDTNVFVVITGDEAVDTETEGTYLVLYNATDSSENVAVEVVRTVIVSGSGNTSGSVPRGQVLGASTGNTGQVLGETKFNFTLPQKLGSRGNEVMELQKFLNNSGFGILVVDGKFGQKTKAALIKFQLANGLAGDGVVGPRTRAVLNK